MKRISRWIVLSLLAAATGAAAVNLPLRIPFQGKLIDPVTNNPKNETVSMCFGIYPAPTGGGPCASAPYNETQTVTVTNGVFSVQIGTKVLLSADLFAGASAYLGVTVGADSEMLPRQPLSMSPYAFTAMQLVDPDDVRINAGVAYSTFTAGGNLNLQYGVTGTTAAFTATGNTQYSLVSSSGVSMLSGTLRLDAASRGLDATGTGVVASTGAFTATGDAQYSLSTSSGINMLAGTLTLEPSSRGLDATGTGVTASSGIFNTVTLSTPSAAQSITVTNTLIDVRNIGFLKLTSNNATSTNRIFCLGAGRPGQILVIKWDTGAGLNEGQLNDGLSGAGSCTSANGAMPAALVAVWPATTNQVDDSITLIFGGSEWTELARSAN